MVGSALLLAAAPARADEGMTLRLPVMGESVFQITSTTFAEWRGEDNQVNNYRDHFLALQQRLDLALQGEEVRVSMRIDGFLPADLRECPPEEATLCNIEADLRPNLYDFDEDVPWTARLPERISVLWQRDWTLEIGDAYAVFGRGMALSFRKDDALGVDNTLRGIRVAIDQRRLVAQAVAGIANPQNLDPVTLAVHQDPRDSFVGFDLGTRIGANDEIETGAHVAHVWFQRNTSTSLVSDADLDVIGWRIGAPSLLDGKLSLYGEADALRRHIDFEGERETRRDFGRAVYGSAQLALERLTVLLEWKDYRRFAVAETTTEDETWRVYSSLPTMERETERVRAPYNQRGASLRLDYAFMPSTWSATATGLMYGFDDHPPPMDEDPWDGVLVRHGWLGLRRQTNPDDTTAWTIEAIAGYRVETHLGDPFGPMIPPSEGDLDRRIVHGEIDGTVAVGDHSFELRVEHRRERHRQGVGYNDFVRGGVSLTWSWRGELIVSPGVRWDTEKGEVAYTPWGDIFDDQPEPMPGDPPPEGFPGQDVYPYLEVKWVFTEGSFVRVAGGRRPGGPICSGGVCRDLPPFEGVVAELVIRR